MGGLSLDHYNEATCSSRWCNTSLMLVLDTLSWASTFHHRFLWLRSPLCLNLTSWRRGFGRSLDWIQRLYLEWFSWLFVYINSTHLFSHQSHVKTWARPFPPSSSRPRSPAHWKSLQLLTLNRCRFPQNCNRHLAWNTVENEPCRRRSDFVKTILLVTTAESELQSEMNSFYSFRIHRISGSTTQIPSTRTWIVGRGATGIRACLHPGCRFCCCRESPAGFRLVRSFFSLHWLVE